MSVYHGGNSLVGMHSSWDSVFLVSSICPQLDIQIWPQKSITLLLQVAGCQDINLSNFFFSHNFWLGSTTEVLNLQWPVHVKPAVMFETLVKCRVKDC